MWPFTKSVQFFMLLGAVLCWDQFTLNLDIGKYRCGEGFSCEDIVCEDIKSCPDGRIIKNAAYCGCCDQCSYENDNRLTKCRRDRYNRKSLLMNKDVYAEDMWIPQCDEDGNYVLKQMKMKKTTCVDTEGNRLFGQDEIYASQNMSCQCSLYMDKLENKLGITFMTKPQEHCTASGDFDKLQCSGNICYCANTITGDVEGRLVLIDHIDKLPCYNEKQSKFSYLKPCEKELIRGRSLRYHFYLKGLDVLGLEKVNCDPDGTFSPLQCDTTRCSCTDENGIQIRSYFAENPKTTLQLRTCNCARDNERAASHFQYSTIECNLLSQCFQENRCFCVDEEGDIISKELNSTTASENFCSELLKDLSISEKLMSSTRPTSETTDEDYEYSDEKYF